MKTCVKFSEQPCSVNVYSNDETGRKDKLKKERKIWRKYLIMLNRNGVVTQYICKIFNVLSG